MSSSLKNLEIAFRTTNVSLGNDMTQLPSELKTKKIKKILYLIPPNENNYERKIKKIFLENIKNKTSWSVHFDEFYLPEESIATYSVLSFSEATSNLDRYIGLLFGKRNEEGLDFNESCASHRGKLFGDEVKRRILFGNYIRYIEHEKKYLQKAEKIISYLRKKWNKWFEEYDIIACPPVSSPPPLISDIQKSTVVDQYKVDLLAVQPNLTGFPHLSIPLKSADKNLVSILCVAPKHHELDLISCARIINEES